MRDGQTDRQTDNQTDRDRERKMNWLSAGTLAEECEHRIQLKV